MEQDEFKRKLAAILSADVKEYSRHMREDETATIRTLTEYREVMAGLIKQHHGRVVDTVGDNLLAEFDSVVDAVQGAVAIQKEVKNKNARLPENRKMVFRIGINLGDLVVEGDRIYGDGVNIAARLEAMADPGGICISRTAFDQIEDKLPFGYEYLGEKTAKNIIKPLRVYKVLFDPEEDAPGPEATKAIDQKEDANEIVGRSREGGRRHKKEDHRPGDIAREGGIRTTASKRRVFQKHVWVYLGVVGFLFIINLLTWSGLIWFHWPALGWGALLLLHGIARYEKEGVRNEERPKIRFYKHVWIYLSVIGFLFIINLLTWSGIIWFHWPALGWGLAIFLHWVKVYKGS